jgi:hypothetical protein
MSETDDIGRFEQLARKLAAAKTRVFELTIEIESVTDRIEDLRHSRADQDALIRALDKRRHMRKDLVQAFAEQERLAAEACIARVAMDFEEEA